MQNSSWGTCFQTNNPNSKYFPFSIILGQFENSFLIFYWRNPYCLHFVQREVELPKLPSVHICVSKRKVSISSFHPERFQRVWAVTSAVPVSPFHHFSPTSSAGRPRMPSFSFRTGQKPTEGFGTNSHRPFSEPRGVSFFNKGTEQREQALLLPITHQD